MEGRSPEFLQNKKEATDSGFSEKRAARTIEGKHVDNSQIKKRNPVIKKRSMQRLARSAKVLTLKTKILKAYEENNKAIKKLLTVLSSLNGSSENDLVTEIRVRQKIQEELLNAIVLEQRRELTEETLPKQLADLIK